MKKTLIAAAALVAMVGCNKTLIESAPVADSNYGYINLGVSADTEMVVTKADNTSEDVKEIINDYNVTVTETVTSVSKNSVYNQITEDFWKVSSGKYEVTVENATIAETYAGENSKGSKRISGTGNVEVFPGLHSTCTVDCTVKNAQLSFLYTDNFAKVFTVADETKVNVSNVANSETGYPARAIALAMTEKADESTIASDAAFFEPEELTWSLTIATKDGNSKTYSSKVTAKESTSTQVLLNTGSVEGEIDITITVNGEFAATETITAVLDPVDGGVTNPAE